MSHTFKMLISNWPRTRKFNRLLHLHAGKAITFDFSHCHALITLSVQFLCSDWSKFDRWVHAENLCSVWKLAYCSWSWQSFVSSCDVLNCLFLLDVQNEIGGYQDCSIIHGGFVYCAFCWQMHRLSKSLEIRFRMPSFWKMSLLTCPCLRRKRIEKSQAIQHLMTFRSSISTGKLEQLLFLMCFFFFGFLKSSVWFMRLKFIHEQLSNLQ